MAERPAVPAEGGTATKSEERAHPAGRLGEPWVVLVWDDPVNLMSYVTYVFQTYFGMPRARAERLMLQVHTEGRAVVASGPREGMERHVEAMHQFGLWATLQKEGA
ncbi:MAG: ATP-dependent Clp protease adapter ClpS [Bifidobacteriaceae bacterium]|jgi:ATP-dependent Clp protease adaptor protein ClpS|nr:ATP-dependent Clp protease adapter ClpS [Bifidobacteriaceae bacterium]